MLSCCIGNMGGISRGGKSFRLPSRVKGSLLKIGGEVSVNGTYYVRALQFSLTAIAIAPWCQPVKFGALQFIDILTCAVYMLATLY